MPSISAPPKQSKYPNIVGSATGAISSELTKKNIDDNLKGDNEQMKILLYFIYFYLSLFVIFWRYSHKPIN